MTPSSGFTDSGQYPSGSVPSLHSLEAVEIRLVHARVALEHNPQRVAQTNGFDWMISIPMTTT